MKFLFALLTICSSTLLFGQSSESKLYKMHIISWSKISDKTTWNSITIDQEGDVFLNQKRTEFSVNIDDFNNKLLEFLTSDEVWKLPANNDPPLEITQPDNNLKNFYTEVRLIEDVENDKKFFSPTTYHLTNSNVEIEDFNIRVFEFLSEDEVSRLKELLD